MSPLQKVKNGQNVSENHLKSLLKFEKRLYGGIIIFLHNSLLAFLFIAPLFLAGSGRMKWLFHSGGDQPPDGSWNDRIGRRR